MKKLISIGLSIAAIIIFICSTHLSAKFIMGLFPQLSQYFAIAIGASLVFSLYAVMSKKAKTQVDYGICILLFALSLFSSIGGMKQKFFKDAQKTKFQEQLNEKLASADSLVQERTKLIKATKNRWVKQVNLDQNQDLLTKSINVISQESQTGSQYQFSGLYLLVVQISQTINRPVQHVEMFFLIFIAFIIDALGSYLTNNIGHSFGVNSTTGKVKNRYTGFMPYCENLWKGVEKTHWDIETLNSTHNMNTKRKVEVQYREILQNAGLIEVRRNKTFATCDYKSFMKQAKELESDDTIR